MWCRQPCKQDFVIPAKAAISCHLSCPDIAVGVQRPTRYAIPLRETRTSRPGKPKLARNIFGLATHKVYPRPLSPAGAVGSYPTFSPLSRHGRDGYFLWHWLSCRRFHDDMPSR